MLAKEVITDSVIPVVWVSNEFSLRVASPNSGVCASRLAIGVIVLFVIALTRYKLAIAV